MIDFQEKRRILISAPRYIVPLTAEETEKLGYEVRIEKDNALSVRGNLADAMKLNLWLRTAHKVQFHLFEGRAKNIDEFYTVINQFEWEDLIPEVEDAYVSIQSATHNDTIRDTRLPNLKAKDAIVDRLTEKYGFRPDSGSETDKTVLFIYWNRDRVSVFLDTSGTPLNRRGYRHQPHKAPLQESLAAALILKSGWDPNSHFVNPMCGSGTLAIEAFLIATKTAPGLLRENYGFMHIKGYDSTIWENLKEEAKQQQLPISEGMIVATDRDPEAIEAAKGNAERANASAHILFRISDFRETFIPVGKGTIIMNPEYGERLGSEKDLQKIYTAVGSYFKRRAQDFSCFVVSTHEWLRFIKLEPKNRYKFYNANIDVEFVEYQIYPSKKSMAETSGDQKPKRVMRSRKNKDE